MKIRDQEVPGNAIATAALTERILQKTGHKVHSASHSMSSSAASGNVVTRITFRCSNGPDGEWLAIVTANADGNGIVAFHSAAGFVEVVEGLCNRIMNGSLQWKEDEYAK